MSFKAYLFRMRTPADVEDVRKLISCETVPAYLDFIYQPDRRVQAFESTDLVAALTVDRGDLAKAFSEEVGITFEGRKPFWMRLDQLAAFNKVRIEDDGDGSRVLGWPVMRWTSETWFENAVEHLSMEDTEDELPSQNPFVRFFENPVECEICGKGTRGRVYDGEEEVVCSECDNPFDPATFRRYRRDAA